MTEPKDRLNASVGARAVEIAILATPFVYASHWVSSKLEPVEVPDSFAYVWRVPLSPSYFSGRSLTQRVLYSLCGVEPRLLSIVQLVCAALTAFFVFLLLRTPKDTWRNIAIAIAIAVLATSFNFTLGSIAMMPEPIFLDLMIAFPFALACYRGRYRGPVILSFGILAAFSKNIAPIIILSELAVYAASRRAWRPLRRADAWLLGVPAVAVLAMVMTQRFDTSVKLNAANVVMQRVLVSDGVAEHFHERHGMPAADELMKFQGRNVLMKLDGGPLFRINPVTQNYELLPDSHPFLRWVDRRGQREYWFHVLLHDPIGSLAATAAGLRDFYSSETVTQLSRYVESHAIDRRVARRNSEALLRERSLGVDDFDERYYLGSNPDVADAVQRGFFASGRDHYDRFGREEGRYQNPREAAVANDAMPTGLLMFDPVASMTNLFRSCGANRLEVLALVFAIAFTWLRKVPDSRPLSVALLLFAGSLIGFFFGLLGDGMEYDRHVSISVITLTVGLFVLAAVAVLRGLSIVASRVRTLTLTGISCSR